MAVGALEQLPSAKVLIMDEPTASLTEREIETLFAIMRSLKAQGTAIIYVSHRLEEIFQICDRSNVFDVMGQVSINAVIWFLLTKTVFGRTTRQ
jgi:ABC-type sugar transport system ATPase subunit